MKKLLLLMVTALCLNTGKSQDAQGLLRSHGENSNTRTMKDAKSLTDFRFQTSDPHTETLISFEKGIFQFDGFRVDEYGKRLAPFADTNDGYILKQFPDSFFTKEFMQKYVWSQIDSVVYYGMLTYSGIDPESIGKNKKIVYVDFIRDQKPGEWYCVIYLYKLPGFGDINREYGIILKSSYCWNMIWNKVFVPKKTIATKPKPIICPEDTLEFYEENTLYVNKWRVSGCDTQYIGRFCEYRDSVWYDTVYYADGKYAQTWECVSCIVRSTRERKIYTESILYQKPETLPVTAGISSDYSVGKKKVKKQRGYFRRKVWPIVAPSIAATMVANVFVVINNPPSFLCKKNTTTQKDPSPTGSQTQPTNNPSNTQGPDPTGSQTQPQEKRAQKKGF